MKFLVLLCFVMSGCLLYAQQEPAIVYGTLNPGELEMGYDATDSTAEAVLLFEKQHVQVNYASTYYISTEYHARIKILKASATDRGNISLVYWASDDDKEKIYDIEGLTYNMENGNVVKTVLPDASIFDEKVSDKTFRKKILLSHVKEGSVIEYRYKRKTPFSVTNTPREWFFQGNIPFKWSELTVSLPSDIHYRMLFTGYLPMYISTTEKGYNLSGEITRYRFVVKDAPSFKDEAYITCRKDYISRIEFGLLSYYYANSRRMEKFSHSFGDIARFLNQHERFGEAIRKAAYPKELLAGFNTISDSLEKLNAIFSYMTKQFQWNGEERLLVTDDLKSVFKNKKGSSAELNLLLLQLLKACGFNAQPVIMSTRQNGEIKEEYPMIDRFDYIIVKTELGGKSILMDATDPNLSPGLLPERCLSNKGYVLQRDTALSISLKPAKTTFYVSIEAELDTAGNLKGRYTETMDKHYGLSYRNYIKTTDEKTLRSNMEKTAPDWEISSWKTENYEEPLKPLKMSFDFSESFALIDRKLFFNPLFFSQTKQNFFNEKERLYPVDLGKPYEILYILNLKLPENFAIEQVPKNISVSLPEKGGKYTYVVETETQVLKVRSKMVIANSWYPASQYRSLRELYQQVIQQEAEQVILKKL